MSDDLFYSKYVYFLIQPVRNQRYLVQCYRSVPAQKESGEEADLVRM